MTNKEEIINFIKSSLDRIGVPINDLKIKKVKNELKVIPIGSLDLEKFCEFSNIKNDHLLMIEFSGINRNTEYILTFKSKENASEEAKEVFINIEKIIEKEIFKIIDEIIEKSKPVFESFDKRIFSKIKNNYQINENFSKVRDWKAKVYLENSRGEGDAEKGEFGQVGYTMIDVDSGFIVPIARSDEHHMGYDLIEYLTNRKLIPKGNYYPIFFGSNYVYNEYPEEVRRAIKAFKIWRENGGENTPVSNGGNSEINFTIKMDDFIKSNGNIFIPNGELLPIGKRIIRYLDKCASLIKDFHLGKNIKKEQVRDYAKLIVSELKGSYCFFKETESLEKAIIEFEKNSNFKKLEEELFSHNGFKNSIHMDIREGIKDPNSFSARDVLKIFGDIDFANREFNRLSMI